MALANEDVAAFVDVELELLALGEPWDSKLAFWSSTLWGYKRALGSAVGGDWEVLWYRYQFSLTQFGIVFF